MIGLRHSRPALCRLPVGLALLCSILQVSCSRNDTESSARRSPGRTFSVMTYNLAGYNLQDRDNDGQKNDPKPAAARAAVISIIAAERPDILAVQEMGNPSIFEEFRYELQNAGLDYPHVEYLRRGESELNLAVLSRFPMTGRQPHIDDKYSIGEAEIPVLRGFIDIDIAVTPEYSFRLFVAHLKSKVFHQLGQTEMRRNEARLLNKHVRAALKENPDANLLVAGDLNDTYSSAALREVTGNKREYLADPRPRDSAGDVWTHFNQALDDYARIDYVLISRGMMPELVSNATRVVRREETYTASDHRPIVAVFRAENLVPADAGTAPK